MISNKTARLLQKLRKERDFTQDDLANKIGVSFQAVSKWERGENLPDSLLLLELAKIYNITVDEILRGELDEQEPIDYKRRNILIMLGVFGFIVSPAPYLLFNGNNESLAITGTLIIIAISVMLFIYIGMNFGQTRKKEDEKSLRTQKIENIVYTSCAAIFLLLGLVWGLFHIAWIIFLFGYVLVLILTE